MVKSARQRSRRTIREREIRRGKQAPVRHQHTPEKLWRPGKFLRLRELTRVPGLNRIDIVRGMHAKKGARSDRPRAGDPDVRKLPADLRRDECEFRDRHDVFAERSCKARIVKEGHGAVGASSAIFSSGAG